jgi:hypothetical protein
MKNTYSRAALTLIIFAALLCIALSIPALRAAFVLFLSGLPTRILEMIAGRTFNPHNLEANWNNILLQVLWSLAVFLVCLSVLYAELFVIPFKRRDERTAVLCITVLIFFSSIGVRVSGHDINFHLGRIEDIASAIKTGGIPTHFNYTAASKAGYGSSISYPELFLYVPALLRVIGFPLNLSYKLFCILINAAAIIVAYYSMRKMTRSKHISVIFCALYGLCLYRLVNINLRAAVGESLGMIFVPLAIAGIYEIFYRGRTDKKKWLTLAIAMSGIAQSHIITLFLTSVFIGLFLIVNFRKLNKENIAALGKAAVTTVLLNMWFIVPFLSYYKYLAHSPPGDLYRTAVFPHQIFAPFVVNSGCEAGRTTAGEMPLSLGITTLLGLIAFIAARKAPLFQRKAPFNHIKQLGMQTFCYGLLALFMASTFFPWVSPPGKSLWLPFNFFNHIQFAWRFFIIAAPLLCMTGSVGLYAWYMTRGGGGVCSLEKARAGFSFSLPRCGSREFYTIRHPR